VTPASSVTDSLGKASAIWNVGKKSGPVQVNYTVLDGETILVSGNFKATAKAANPKSFNKKEGDDQVGVVTTLLDGVLKIQVSDTFGNGVDGLRVTWTPSNNSGNVSVNESFTDNDGIASVNWTLGTHRGTQSINVVVYKGTEQLATLTFDADAKPGSTTTESGLSFIVEGSAFFGGGNRTVQFTSTLVDNHDNPYMSDDVNWFICAGEANTTCSTSTVSGISIAASNPATEPPSAVVTIPSTGVDGTVVTIFAKPKRGQSRVLGSLTTSIRLPQ
jgi:hypothetical protein